MSARGFLPAALLIVLHLAAPSLWAKEAKVIAVPRTTSCITIDGSLSEAAWSKAARIASFEHYQETGPLKNQTQAFLLYDYSALYVGFKLSESNIWAIKAAIEEHDGTVWSDDCVEILLDTRGDRASYVHFILGAGGGKYDALGDDAYGYNPQWEGVSRLGATGWVAEIRIPFSELGLSTPKPGDAWTGNFCREEQPAAELSCWSPTMGGFDAPGRFGEIVFGALGDRIAAQVARTSRDLAEARKAAAVLHRGGEGLLGEAQEALGVAAAMVRRSADLNESQYLEAQSALRKADNSLAGVREMIRRTEMGSPEYLVWETTPWRHFSPREDVSAVRGDTTKLDVVCLAGQTESRALMVSNLTDETLSARLLVDGCPKNTIEILVPTFVRTADGRAFPDALVPPDPIGQLTIPPHETRQVWLNITSPHPGRFDGRLTVSPLTASKTDKSVILAVEVVGLPAPMPGPLAFTWDYLGDAANLGLEREYVQSMVGHGIRVFMVSGLHYLPRPKADDSGEFLEPVDWSKFERYVTLVWRPGRKLCITMDVWEKASERPIYNGRFNTPGWRAAFRKIIAGMAEKLRGLGLSYDDYMVNPLDESIDARYVTIAALIREVDPKIRLVEDTVGSSLDEVKAADPYVDYWVPHFKSLRADSVRSHVEYMRSTGEPLGFYFYSEGANEKAQDSYGHYLWKFWWAYSQGLDGIFGYWTATQHYGNPWKRHQSESAYDPSLFYYGNGCVITGRRWEAWRRGIEDYALLKACETSGVDKSLISAVVKTVLDSPTDPDVAAAAREKLIQTLRNQVAEVPTSQRIR